MKIIKRPLLIVLVAVAVMIAASAVSFGADSVQKRPQSTSGIRSFTTVTPELTPGIASGWPVILQEITADDDKAEADDQKKQNTTDSTALSGKSLRIKSVTYDPAKKEVVFRFNQSVSYKNTKVSVRYKTGKNQVVKIRKKSSKKLVVKVKKLKYGRKYSYKIKGVMKSGSQQDDTLTGAFRAVDK